MDFIERWFHVNPDGGSGISEALYVCAAICLAATVIFMRRIVGIVRRRAASRDPQEIADQR